MQYKRCVQGAAARARVCAGFFSSATSGAIQSRRWICFDVGLTCGQARPATSLKYLESGESMAWEAASLMRSVVVDDVGPALDDAGTKHGCVLSKMPNAELHTCFRRRSDAHV